jgi:hypothetical protein
MTKYYTTIETINNKFVGYVFNESNNQKLYQTPEYDIQSHAINDVNNFVTSNGSMQQGSIVNGAINNINTYVNTIKQAVPTVLPRTGRCCGR